MDRVSAGSKGRQLLMLWIRKNVKHGGMPVNRRGFRNTKEPDVQALFKKGLIKQVREIRGKRSCLTRLLPVDGIGFDGDVICPDCGGNLSRYRAGERPHAVNCSLRTDHSLDPGSTKRREQLKRQNDAIRRWKPLISRVQ